MSMSNCLRQEYELRQGLSEVVSEGICEETSPGGMRPEVRQVRGEGYRSVVEYDADFLRLSHYTRGMVATEHGRCIHFEDGLRDNLRVLSTLQREQKFTDLVENVKITEDVKHVGCQNRDRERGKNKRDLKPSSSVQRPKKKAKSEGLVRVGAPVALIGLQSCSDCGSTKPQRVVQQPPRGCGQARGGNGMGHRQRASGRSVGQIEARQPALVYAVRCREDRDAHDVITGTFLIFDVPYTALIDIGFIHSYVASTISETLRISVESTSSKATVLSPLGQSVRVSKLYRDIPLMA
ncbi:uncharacterized protein LOC108462144 [Gossypium arboreum]|uniref:uncharacterized protein LOC108462144 n=1 Tax=Gossypium arboreum TaxID=29729 RepID=UPI0008191C39|nr:uncharacterized protein LOC108462144 [Gossypium arboreum]